MNHQESRRETGEPKAESLSLPISIRQVTKTYGKICALYDITLEIESGEFLTLLGPSGSGKTTLLMVLAGFVRPDSGSVLFGNREMVRTPPHKRDLGMVFQNYALFPHMDVLKNVSYPLRLRGHSKTEVARKARDALALVDLADLGSRRIDQLSGGQKQRVALARAIVFEPRILLMDEPLSALDKKLRERMQIEIRRLHERLGMTTIYVTHDQREALTMSDRIAVINDGGLKQLDTPERLYERPRNRFVADFIGGSSFLDVTLREGRAWLGDRPLRMDEAPPDGTGPYSVLLRPEKLQILREDSLDDLNRIDGVVSERAFQGETFVLYVRLGGGTEISVRGLSRREELGSIPSEGQPVTLGLHAEDTILVLSEDV